MNTVTDFPRSEPAAAVRVANAMAPANDSDQLALIQPFEFTDEVTGDTISVSVSPQYSKITVNRREYYFKRENGEFDGVSTILVSKGPFSI